MAKVFFDTNFFIDLAEKRKLIDIKDFLGQDLYISPLSIHILTYVYKYKIPDKNLSHTKKYFNFINFDQAIVEKSSQGPTIDFEDNVQLHSAAEADCDFFLTSDEKLLKMKFFGKVKLASNL